MCEPVDIMYVGEWVDVERGTLITNSTDTRTLQSEGGGVIPSAREKSIIACIGDVYENSVPTQTLIPEGPA